MARARSASGRAAAQITEITRMPARVFRANADVGVLGPVGGFGDGQGAFSQRQGRGEITETAHHPGEGVQGGADGGVLGPVRGFRGGQRPFGQWPGLPEPALGMQVRSGAVEQPVRVRGDVSIGGVLDEADHRQHVWQQHRPLRPVLRGVRVGRCGGAQHSQRRPQWMLLCHRRCRWSAHRGSRTSVQIMGQPARLVWRAGTAA